MKESALIAAAPLITLGLTFVGAVVMAIGILKMTEGDTRRVRIKGAIIAGIAIVVVVTISVWLLAKLSV